MVVDKEQHEDLCRRHHLATWGGLPLDYPDIIVALLMTP
jgi:hypothetical protein